MNTKLDDFDCAILKRLQKDASQSIDIIAQEVHLSRNACWRRIKLLETEGIIKAKVALVDAEKVGLGLSVLVMIRTNSHEKNWLDVFQKAVHSMPEIQGAHRMSGDLDYVLRVKVKDVKAYDQFYNRLIAKVSISDISASFVMEDIKDTTVLNV